MESAMATASPSMDVKEELKCPICMEYLTDPVTLDCGHNFCRGCITQYCKTWEDLGDLECPLCKGKIKRGHFRSNWQLANVVEKFKCLSHNLEKMDLCVKHKEKLNLFCKEDKELICVCCERSYEHRLHTVLLLEEAAEECKDQLYKYLEILQLERERILENKAGAEKESEDLFSQIEAQKTKMMALFRRLHEFLEEQNMLFLSQWEELEKEIVNRREEHMAKLVKKLSSLEGLIQQMEEKCRQPTNEFLQDSGWILQRSGKKEVFENPVAFPSELIRRISRFCKVKPLLEGVMKQFPEEQQWTMPLAKELSQIEIPELKISKSQSPEGNQPKVPKDTDFLTKIRNLNLNKTLFKKGRKLDPSQLTLTSVPANVTLDPNTAHPQLILSKDLQSVKVGEERQDLPDNPERFDWWQVVLGHEGFTAGTHFWEVIVKSGGTWAVGVARESVSRKGKFDFGPEEGIWAIGKFGGAYIAVGSPHSILSLTKEPRKIQVTVNCVEKKVSFSDADTGVHIYTFTKVPLYGENVLPFFYVFGKAHLKLSP